MIYPSRTTRFGIDLVCMGMVLKHYHNVKSGFCRTLFPQETCFRADFYPFLMGYICRTFTWSTNLMCVSVQKARLTSTTVVGIFYFGQSNLHVA